MNHPYGGMATCEKLKTLPSEYSKCDVSALEIVIFE